MRGLTSSCPVRGQMWAGGCRKGGDLVGAVPRSLRPVYTSTGARLSHMLSPDSEGGSPIESRGNGRAMGTDSTEDTGKDRDIWCILSSSRGEGE